MDLKLSLGTVTFALAIALGSSAYSASVGATAGDGNCNTITVTIGGDSYDNCFYDDGQDEPDTNNPEIIPGANISLLENLNGVTALESTDGNTVDPVFGDLGTFEILGKNDGASNNDGTVDLGGTGGNFGGTLDAVYDYFVVSLKAGNGYFAFLFDNVGGGLVSGSFSGLPNSLSHITYAGVCIPTDVKSCDEPPGEFDVPVPAGLPLVLSGLGIMGIMRARKRKAA